MMFEKNKITIEINLKDFLNKLQEIESLKEKVAELEKQKNRSEENENNKTRN